MSIHSRRVHVFVPCQSKRDIARHRRHRQMPHHTASERPQTLNAAQRRHHETEHRSMTAGRTLRHHAAKKNLCLYFLSILHEIKSGFAYKEARFNEIGHSAPMNTRCTTVSETCPLRPAQVVTTFECKRWPMFQSPVAFETRRTITALSNHD